MMSFSVFYYVPLLCFSLTNTKADLARYYDSYECNEALVEGAKLTATSSLRERGPENAKLYGEPKVKVKDYPNIFADHEINTVNHIKRNNISLKIFTQKYQAANLKPIYLKTMAQVYIRWAFNTSTWSPSYEQILAASSFIQPEEKERISRFVFQDDAKSSLIGRLMLRKFVHTTTFMEYQNICFGRDDHGKPYLLSSGDVPVNFNISHQGNYVVLGGNEGKNIGIDIMKIEPPANKNIKEFFRIMKRQFSDHEWKTIYSYPTESEQIACFYRMWCLKESYVKNIGLGITVALNEISFNVKSELNVGQLTTDTKLYVRNCLKADWIFEETLLDDKHAVAVSSEDDNGSRNVSAYKFLSYDDLVTEAKPLTEPDAVFANNFVKKKNKPI